MYIQAVLISIFTILSSIYAMKLDWLPSSADGPLPLSVAYRSKLRRLCDQVERYEKEGLALSPEISVKRDVIKKLCGKLRSDDENIAEGSREDVWSNTQRIVFIVIILFAVHQVTQTEFARHIQNRTKQMLQQLTYKPNRAERRAHNKASPSSQQMANNIAGSGSSLFGGNAGATCSTTTSDAREARLRRFN